MAATEANTAEAVVQRTLTGAVTSDEGKMSSVWFVRRNKEKLHTDIISCAFLHLSVFEFLKSANPSPKYTEKRSADKPLKSAIFSFEYQDSRRTLGF